jgi:D-cysteine desulfhydrase
MPGSDLALFRAYPGLRRTLPRRPLLERPTPVEALRLEGRDHADIWVKRDEHSCPLYGGNKPRKLEFVIGAACARRSRRLVTTGGLGTHHGLATAILGRAAGLAATLVLIRQPMTPEVQHTLLLQAAYGARLVYGGNVPGAALATAGELIAAWAQGERPFLVSTGGSSTRGNVGFVSAALELGEQVRAGQCPEPAEIYLPVGTGGSLAGLAAGLRVAGLRSRIVGVLVTDILPPSPRSLAAAARRVARLLHRLDPAFPAAPLEVERIELATGQLGDGYGAPTPAAERALGAAADAGLRLETTYTGKCLAELLDRRRRGALRGGPVLFWNTYNAVDAEAAAPRTLDPDALPRRLRGCLRHPND